MSFEWRTDEEKGWQEPIKVEETAVPQSFWRRWRFLLVALLGMVAVWGVVQWQINQRIATATVEIESELLATHNFVLQTAVDQDETLFKANLSGRDPGWGEVQKRLLNEGLLLDRPMLGWQHEAMPDQLTSEAVTVTLDATFNAAELIYPQMYVVQGSSGLTETVTLQQTAVYRQGGTRWLYAPPYAEFWGDWHTQGGDYLTLAYPERDRDVAVRLGVDLNALLDRMCTDLDDFNCDSGLRVNLRLDTDPDSILDVNEFETMVEAGLRLEMPTPTLIGLPVDEAGYDVLFRAYGVQVATAVLAHQAVYDCCRHELFFRALLDYQLAQLDLQVWPLTEAMFGQTLLAGFDGQSLSYWTRSWRGGQPQTLKVWVVEEFDAVWPRVYMLIEYLMMQETAVSPIEMMRLLERNSYRGWMQESLAGHYDNDNFPNLFLEHIYERSIGGQQAEPPIPFPNGEITVICSDYEFGVNDGVYAYDLSTQTWREKLTNMEIDTLTDNFLSTSDGQHFILTESDFNNQVLTQRFYLVTEEEKIFLEEVEILPEEDNELGGVSYTSYVSYSFASSVGNGLSQDKILRYEYEGSAWGAVEVSVRSLACPTKGCPEIASAGFPQFSPTGQYFIEENRIESEEELTTEFSLVSADGELRQAIGRGRDSFWLTDDSYGFIRTIENGWELAVASLSNPELSILLNEADLLAEVGDMPNFSARNVFSIAHTQDLLLQGQTDVDSDGTNRLFLVRLTDDFSSVVKIESLWAGAFSGYYGGDSPDGRYIVLAEYDSSVSSSSFISNLYLLERENLQADPIVLRSPSYGLSWSPDGQWFVQNTEHYMLLHALAYDYQYFIPHEGSACQQVILSVDE